MLLFSFLLLSSYTSYVGTVEEPARWTEHSTWKYLVAVPPMDPRQKREKEGKRKMHRKGTHTPCQWIDSTGRLQSRHPPRNGYTL